MENKPNTCHQKLKVQHRFEFQDLIPHFNMLIPLEFTLLLV